MTDTEGKKHIAVVEDNEDNGLILCRMLEDRYRVTRYEDGMSALEGIKKDKPDLVLLDFTLPDIDGTQVLKQIRQESALKGLPVVALTARAMIGDREQFLKDGFDDYVSKPILDEEPFNDLLKRLLERGS